MDNVDILTKEYGDLGIKLIKAQKYVLNRYKYYNDEQKQVIDDLRNELLINHFINAESIQHLFSKSFMNKIIKGALISGCAFVRIVMKSDNNIELIPYDACYVTGSLNNDNTLERALSIDDTDNNGNPTLITYYTKEKIIIKDLKNNKIEKIRNDLKVIPMVPIIFNQNSLKPFGCSFITRKMMKTTDILMQTGQCLENIKYDTSKNEYFNMVLSIQQDLVEAVNLVATIIHKMKQKPDNAELKDSIDIVFENKKLFKSNSFVDDILKDNQVMLDCFEKEQLNKISDVNGDNSLLNSLKKKEGE